MPDQEPAASGAQRRIQLPHRAVDELDPPISATRQPIENVGIEDEGAKHPPRPLQGSVQGGMVVIAQIATKPNQGSVVDSHVQLG